MQKVPFDSRDKRQLAELLRSHGIMDKWHEQTWDDFTNDARAKKIVLNYVANYREAKKDHAGLFLFGNAGVGKSLLINLAFKDLLINHRQDVQIVPFNAIVTSFTSGWYDKGERVSLEKMMSVDFLAIEGLGEEFRSGELHATTFETLLKNRLQRNKPTWVITRLAAATIRKDYGDNIASLIREACVDVTVKGDDFRAKIYEANQKKYRV
jgi:DNA replication protein DnaC